LKYLILKISFCIALYAASSSIRAQQEWLFTQHTFNLYDINAAHAGDGSHGSAAFRYRNQWTGIEGSPNSVMASMHNSFRNQKLAYGIKLFREEIGAHRDAEISGSLNYKIQLNSKGKLSFAIRAGLGNQYFDIGKLRSIDFDDPKIMAGSQSRWSPLLAAAVLYRSKYFYAGLEASRLLSSSYISANTESKYFQHFHFITGYVSPINVDWQIRSSFLMRSTSNLDLQPEIQIAALYSGKCWIGTGYRKDFGFLAYTELLLSPYFRIGYSYDIPTGTIKPGGSHEVFAGIQFKRKGGTAPSIRYF